MTLALLSAVQLANAQEQIPRKEALKIAFVLTADPTTLEGTPIPTDVDVKRPVAVKEGDYGAMVLPEAKLSADAIAKAGDKVLPLGQLWLHKLTPMRDGQAVSKDQLRLVVLETGEGSATGVQCALGVKANGSGDLELLVYGKANTPVVKVPLKKAENQQQLPITMTAERTDDAGKITLKILGRYQAIVPVTQLEL